MRSSRLPLAALVANHAGERKFRKQELLFQKSIRPHAGEHMDTDMRLHQLTSSFGLGRQVGVQSARNQFGPVSIRRETQ